MFLPGSARSIAGWSARRSATWCYIQALRSISQRELRNDNAVLIREVEGGESFTVTRRGVPVARLVPLTEVEDLACERPARLRHSWSDQPRVSLDVPTGELLEDLRGDR